MTAQPPSSAHRLERANIDTLFTALQQEGYQIIGPVVRDGAILYDEITTSDDLPIGWTDKQEPGSYRLERRNNAHLFGYVVGPWSWKRYLFPPREKLWSAQKTDKGFELIQAPPQPKKLAFLGIRACEIQAIAVQDKVFLGEAHPDPGYQSRREPLFMIAVNCSQAGGTCFCASMGNGPKATSGFDLALTEILDDQGHYFLIESGSLKGEAILSKLPLQDARTEEIQKGEDLIKQTTQQMGRTLDTTDIKDLLYRNLEHDRWDDVAERCLSCANCTLVCPTCFCSDVEDVTDLTGEHAERWRQWDSCFNQDFSYIHGGNIRSSVKSRYRQWMTHKLGTWIDQFGTSGCVGCGRCITWCPVGIDITEETKAIRATDSASVGEGNHD